MNIIFKGHVASLDGLRAVAVMSVMAVHSGIPGFQSGWLGVDLFFALSGFLITTLLLQEHDKHGDVSLRNFFARRFLRLMPAYSIYIIGITATMWLWSGSILSIHGGWTPELYTISLWAYFVNFAPMGGIWNGQEVTIHLWSLAVEEQYYLIWPVAMLFFLRTRYLMHVVWGGAFITLAIFIGTVNEFTRATMLYTRGMSLFIASALAVSLWQSSTAKRFIINAASSSALLIGMVAVICLCFAAGATNILSENQVRHLFLPLLSCGFGLIVIRCAATDAWVPSLLAHPWLVKIGKISYGIYLYHELARVSIWYFTSQMFSELPRYFTYGLRITLYFLITFLIASLSYRLLELPFLQLKKRYRT